MHLNQKKFDEYYQALLTKDVKYEGAFFACISSTGIFCRSSCHARKPKKENVEFVLSSQEALRKGYRPCKVCSPMQALSDKPEWLKVLFTAIETEERYRFSDEDIKALGIDPNRVRRWFKKNHNMTFQAYLRSLRMGQAFGHLNQGGKVIDAAMEHGYESLSGFTQAFKQLTGRSPKNINANTVIESYQLLTPLGPMLAASINEKICLLEFNDRRMLETQLIAIQKHFKAPIVLKKNKVIEQLQEQLNEYFAGKRKTFSVSLYMVGSDFQKQVWQVLMAIPYGEVRSYKQQAQKMKHPKAVRAVANANGANKIAIVIPCHRVIGSDGSLCGYGGGLERKEQLLKLEGYKI
ncbi:MAG TPA: methylated-DNA--[protein]-cysteine S-methyltransferase [Oligoflexia bacterium]|nr:methylated-DNA--[protein]-cysteine S-methyltransferase [Oligoflexia bacterium]HMR24627.1 methylated-DNA--[protein]-cysteine S-methyltransferase [Oligoflexia bacterium]